MSKILLIVDPQRDFMDNGSLPVVGSSDKMIALSSHLSKIDLESYDKIIVTLDWHPINHCSFKTQGGQWPQHCVEFTDGALVTKPLLNVLDEWRKNDKCIFVTKGTSQNKEEYSIVQNIQSFSKIHQPLELANQIDVCGVVGTVCVKNTLQDLCTLLGPNQLNVLLEYTAQFSKDDEAEFVAWLDSLSIKHS